MLLHTLAVINSGEKFLVPDFRNAAKCDMGTFGGRIRYYRILAGYKQSEVAEYLGMDRTAYMNTYERKCGGYPSLDVVNKICDFLNVEFEMVYDDYLKFISGNYGQAIKEFREKHGLKKVDIQRMLCISKAQIRFWEKEEVVPSRNSFEKIMKLFTTYNVN